MKRMLLALGLFAAVSGNALASVNVNVNVGVPVVVAPDPVIVVDRAPEFILVPDLGFHVSIGLPVNIFYVGGGYYVFKNDRWYHSRYSRGPWRYVEHRHLPPGLAKHRYKQMLDWRDREYESYRKDHDRGKHKYYRPNDDRREERREDRREERREDRRDDWKGDHGRGHKD